MKKNQLANYSDVLGSTKGVMHLLLGNGFSIACDPVFKYNNIFEFAKQNGLSPHVLELFAHFGTTNFELIVRALEDTIFIGQLYQSLNVSKTNELKNGITQIKEALLSAIAKTHLATPSGISEGSRNACVDFLKPYKNIFTTNYDLLLYWVFMKGKTDEQLKFEDGFRSSVENPDANYVVFSDHLGAKDGLFYLHGALHLFEQRGEVRKHCWKRSGVSITDNVLASLNDNSFPLFVAEGDSSKKLETILRSSYLSYCYQKMQRLSSTLVVCGNSLGASDEHILRAIADGSYTTVWLGVFGDSDSSAAKGMEVVEVKLQDRRKKNKNAKALDVKFYDVRSAPIWSACSINQPKKPSSTAIPFSVKSRRKA